jgi:Fur family ferric uptake transcriptional regulator
MNKTTVYRTLDLLIDLDLVTEHKCGDGRAQYEPASRGRHSHMICRECGVMVDIDLDLAVGIVDSLRERHGFRADLEGYPLMGLCPRCSR